MSDTSKPIPHPLDLLEWPHPLLCMPSKPVLVFDDILTSLVEQMWITLTKAGGVGLAAPQVGSSQRLFIMDCSIIQSDATHQVYINPTLSNHQGITTFKEGCLSFPGLRVDIPRFETVDIQAQDLSGQWFTRSLTGLEAICAQHEFDHIEGKAFIDRLEKEQRNEVLVEYHQFLQDRLDSSASLESDQPSITLDTLSRVEELLHRLHQPF